MNFEDYQKLTGETAIYPGRGSNYTYPVLGLAGESGEVAEKFKKLIRDKNGVMDDEFKAAVKKELGDVLWYVSAICSELNLSMNDVAEANIEKLFGRKERGTLQGSGDNR